MEIALGMRVPLLRAQLLVCGSALAAGHRRYDLLLKSFGQFGEGGQGISNKSLQRIVNFDSVTDIGSLYSAGVKASLSAQHRRDLGRSWGFLWGVLVFQHIPHSLSLSTPSFFFSASLDKGFTQF
jgi:hypothetical protein